MWQWLKDLTCGLFGVTKVENDQLKFDGKQTATTLGVMAGTAAAVFGAEKLGDAVNKKKQSMAGGVQ